MTADKPKDRPIERNLRGIEALISQLKQHLASLEAHAKQLRKLLTLP